MEVLEFQVVDFYRDKQRKLSGFAPEESGVVIDGDLISSSHTSHALPTSLRT